jgi:D-glycero-D-manno-heptose 1,7-bisphosphate phosphatase
LSALVDGIGCWAWTGGRRFDGRPALFLDRDGVVVEETGYLGRAQDVAMIPAAAPAIAAFNQAGVPVVVVTNQSGVARGLFGWDGFEAVQAEIAARLAGHGAHFDAVFACAYHDVGSGPLSLGGHAWRKPKPGMLLEAADRLGVALEGSLIVGDKAGDLKAGRAAGLPQGLHVATGHGGEAERTAALALQRPGFQVHVGADVGAALARLPALAGSPAPC